MCNNKGYPYKGFYSRKYVNWECNYEDDEIVFIMKAPFMDIPGTNG